MPALLVALRKLPSISNAHKVALINFFANLYFYAHIHTIYLQLRGLDLLQISSIESIIFGVAFFAEIPTGIIADRIGRKWSVVFALILQAIGEVCYMFGRDFLTFAGIAVIYGVAVAFYSGSAEALVYDTLPVRDRKNRMTQAVGTMGSAYMIALVISPLIGGWIVSRLVLQEFLFAIFLTACSIGVALLISLTLKEPPGISKPTHESSLTILKQGIRTIRDNPKLRHIFLATVLTSSFVSSLLHLYQPMFVWNDISPFYMGAALSVGSLLGAVLHRYAYKMRDWFGYRRAMILVTVLPGVFFVLLSVSIGAPMVFLMFVLTYGVCEMKEPLFVAYQNEHIESCYRATTLSCINMVSNLYMALMMVVFGAIALFSIRTAFIIAGILIISFSFLTRVDRLATCE